MQNTSTTLSMAGASAGNGWGLAWTMAAQWANQSARRAGRRWTRERRNMNRKKRNKWKLLHRHGFTAWAGSIAWQIPPHPDFARKSNQVNDSQKAARLRRLYHRCADWDCPKSAGIGGWRACGRCKWRRSCKTPVGCGYAWMTYGIMTR